MPADGGIRFGQYVLLRRIARGGMAEVFLAQQRGLEGFDRRVAVKRILPHLADSPDFVKMFLGEAKLAAQLTHPNVVHIYDFGKVDNDYFIAMEYVEGVHAGQLFKYGERERLSPTMVARVGADAATALHYAHELRAPNGKALALVHRDVSPANLMVSYDGVVKLCDFGIAKAAAMSDQLTNPGQVKGKYAYMSPEQTIASPLDGRSDVFSLAVVLWELLAGKTIVPRGDAVEAMRAIRDGRLPSLGTVAPDVPRALVDAITWGLQTKREHRATAADLAQALEAFIKASPELATPMQLGNWVKLRFPREVTGSHQAITPDAQLSGSGTGDHGTLAAPMTGEADSEETGPDDDGGGDGTAISEGGTMGEPGTSLTSAIAASMMMSSSDPDFDSATIMEPHKPMMGEDSSGVRAVTGRLMRPRGVAEAAHDDRATLDDSDYRETSDGSDRDTASDDFDQFHTTHQTGPRARASAQGFGGATPTVARGTPGAVRGAAASGYNSAGMPGGPPVRGSAPGPHGPPGAQARGGAPGGIAGGTPGLNGGGGIPNSQRGGAGGHGNPGGHGGAGGPGMPPAGVIGGSGAHGMQGGPVGNAGAHGGYGASVGSGPNAVQGYGPASPGGPSGPNRIPDSGPRGLPGRGSGPIPGSGGYANGGPRASHAGFGSGPVIASPGEETIVTPGLRPSQQNFPETDPNLLYPETALGTLHVRPRPIPRRAKLIAALVGIGLFSFVVALASTRSCNEPPVTARGSLGNHGTTPASHADAGVALASSSADAPAAAPVAPPDAPREPTISALADAGTGGSDLGAASLVTVNTQPAGGTVKIGTEGARRTPAQFALVPGRYPVIAELEGYQPVQLELEVSSVDSVFEIAFVKRIADGGGGTTTRPTPPSPPVTPDAQTGRLTVRTTPYSEVYLGTKKLGETPFAELPLPVGKYTLVFKNPDHPTVRRTVTIEPNQTAKLLFDLP